MIHIGGSVLLSFQLGPQRPRFLKPQRKGFPLKEKVSGGRSCRQVLSLGQYRRDLAEVDLRPVRRGQRLREPLHLRLLEGLIMGTKGS